MSDFNMTHYNRFTINAVEKVLSRESAQTKLAADMRAFKLTGGEVDVIPTGLSGCKHKSYVEKQKTGNRKGRK